jgi:hypothetical protein
MSQNAKILDLTSAPATFARRPSDRCLRALESMEAISVFDRHYQRGTPIPAAIWKHAEIVGEYLGFPSAAEWLPMFLHRILEQ